MKLSKPPILEAFFSEWIRSQLGEDPLSYEKVPSLLAETKKGPTGIIYLPYLSGSGAPSPDPSAQAAFIGLKNSHKRSDLLKAVLEGTAYELESIRRVAEKVTMSEVNKIIAVGGGTRN
jgi:sugar (pentulose or hexulose) kinase